MSTAYQKTARSANAEVIVPAEVTIGLGEVVESAKEGLLALAVGTGPKVLLGPVAWKTRPAMPARGRV